MMTESRLGGSPPRIPASAAAWETVRFRQEDYVRKTAPVIEYFTQHRWPVRIVDAIGDIDQVFGRTYAAIFWR